MNEFLVATAQLAAAMRQLAAELPWLASVLLACVAWTVAWPASALARHALAPMCEPFPFARGMLRKGFNAGRSVLFLLLLHLLLRTLPPRSSGTQLAQDLSALLLVAALTWLLVRVVSAVARTIVELNPVDAPDNLRARRVQTQTRVLARTATALVVLVGSALALMTQPTLREIGASLLASAGLAGLAVGFAARSIFSNLLAGVQLALTQPIRLDDVVIVQGEWGRVEEITSTYVVVQVWDQRRMVVPLNWFIENPFQNWTRHSAEILGSVLLWLDYRVPVGALRAEAERICKGAPEWDGRLVETQVVETSERAIQVRVLVSAVNSEVAWKLRCIVREELVAFVRRDYPECLPRLRAELEPAGGHADRAPLKDLR